MRFLCCFALALALAVSSGCKDLEEADFGHANLSEAYCQETDFQGARFLDTNFTKADLRNALNYAIRPGDNLLKKTHFSLPEATSLLYGLDIILDD